MTQSICIALDFIDGIAVFPDVLDQLIEREEAGDYLFSITETAETTVVNHSFIIQPQRKFK